MQIEWVIIEFLTIVVECSAMVFFLHSRFKSKTPSPWPQWIVLVSLIASGTVCTFANLPFFEINVAVILLTYTCITKYAKLLHKVFGVLICFAISSATSLVGAGITAVITGASFWDTSYVQDTPRLLALIIIKTIQVIVYYVLSKKHLSFRNLQKGPAVILSGAAAIDFACLLLIFFLIQKPLDAMQTALVSAVSAGLLVITVSIFALYEMFIRNEIRNLELQTQVQRLELEAHFYQEIDAMYSDMRIWRHDYQNNLLALRGLLNEGEQKNAVEYIDKILEEPMRKRIILQTGNTVLDAVVSAKLLLAQSKDIDVSVQVAYPEAVSIADNDLCAIAGNLMDNAIEACDSIGGKTSKKYIDFSILTKGRNIIITVRNSTNGIFRMDGDTYLTTKKGAYHGMGLKHVDHIVHRYQGYVHRERTGDSFETYVLLPLTG